MSNNQSVNVECSGKTKKIPLPNPFISVKELKSIISGRFNIDYPCKLTYDCADLCDEDLIHDLGLNPSHFIRVRRCSIDNTYTTNSITDIYLSYEKTHQNIIVELKQELEQRNYICWLDIEQLSNNIDHFSSAMEQGIQKSTVFLCCITNRYIHSNKCRQELTFAKECNKKIILLIMEQISWPPQQIRNLVSDLSYIEFYITSLSNNSISWSRESFDELLERLGGLAPQL